MDTRINHNNHLENTENQRQLLAIYNKKFSDLISPFLIKDDEFLKQDYLNAMEADLALLVSLLDDKENSNSEAELSQLFTLIEQSISSIPVTEHESRKESTLVYLIGRKLYPLVIANLERQKEDTNYIDTIKGYDQSDQKKYLKGKLPVWVSLPDKYMPQWYLDMKKQQRYQKLLLQSLTDPTAAKLLQDTHQQAMDELNSKDK